ncbi:zona pellucida sperm-binding protein 4-like [Phyllopteryx taeniolatus]|uniref:zona pellucida sperm-binding protein 4-like n=1 Tax=Phyllopteryx taeniolatus TaxID=161469 RepID=UPI002AD3F0F9|nr:zona pellucida sperm-binding protein 4-like [Phyllopteryx taeniolatus]
MIKHWSVTSFLALALLWCFTGTKVEAWKPSSGQNLPDPPFLHRYDPLRPPYQNPLPKPSPPKPSAGLSPPKPNNPSHPGPPYSPDHVFPPYVPAGSNFHRQNFQNPNFPLPWPFLPSPPLQNPPPPQKPFGEQHNPLATGPYVFLKPPYDPLSQNPKFSQLPLKYPSLSHQPVDSPSEKPSNLVVHHPLPYNPTVPVYPPSNLPKPPNSKPQTEQQRVALLYYDAVDQLPNNPSLPRPPLLPVHHLPSYPSFHPKPVDRPQQNPSTPPPVHQQQTGPVYPVPNNPSFPQLPVGPPYSHKKGKTPLPRGYSDDDYSQEPQPKQPWKETSVPYPPSVKDPNFHNCDVIGLQRIPCGSSDISVAACEAISCCYDGDNCYFGKSVTVQCTKDAQFILVAARDATLPNIDIETISLLAGGPGCTQVDSNSGFSIYQFPVTACGSIVTEEAGKIIYENRMTSSYEVAVGLQGAITRDSNFDLLFQCRYTDTSVETFVAEILALESPPLSVAALGPINVQLRLGNGQCLSKGCNEVEVAYSSFYTDADYPIRKILRDNVYVEVQLMDRTDHNLGLSLVRCWTTTSANPHTIPQWDILINGCPNIDDRYTSMLVPVGPGSGVEFPSHHRRFIFRMFTFVDPSSLMPQSEHVYIHCSTSLCKADSGHSCEPICFRKKRDVTSVAQTKEESKIVVSAGPLVMSTP